MNTITLLFLGIAVPLAASLAAFPKGSRITVVYMLLGMTAGVAAAYLNGTATTLFDVNMYYYTTSVSPFIEEILKALPIIFYAYFINDGKRRLTGLGMAVGVGFAVIENVYYMTSSTVLTMPLVLSRAFGSGLMHGLCSAMMGLGFSYVREKKKLHICGSFGLFALAASYHSYFNMLVQSDYQIFGLILPLATYIPLAVIYDMRGRGENDKKQES